MRCEAKQEDKNCGQQIACVCSIKSSTYIFGVRRRNEMSQQKAAAVLITFDNNLNRWSAQNFHS
jgi:DNA-binding transcriptional regulator YiaG